MALFRAATRSSGGTSVAKSSVPSSASETTPLTSPRAEVSDALAEAGSSSGQPQHKKHKFGFSEVAHLFIKMRRHRRRASVSRSAPPADNGHDSLASAQAAAGAQGLPQTTAVGQAVHFAGSTPGSGNTDTNMSDDDLTPPATPHREVSPPGSPRRVQIRHFGHHSIFHRDGKANKPHHLYCSSGEEPISHPGMKESALVCPPLPVEYTDRFECAGGVNVVTLLRATRNTLLDTVKELGWNALVDEKWECTICGPKHGTYKVEVSYSASATQCGSPDSHRPVALDRVKGIPGLMTIVKREDV